MRPWWKFRRAAGAAVVVSGVVLLGAYTTMGSLLTDWRAHDQGGLLMSAPGSLAALPEISPPKSASPALEKPVNVRVLASVAMVKDLFSRAGYSLDAVRRGQVAVPRLLHASLPYDLESVAPAAERKAVFLRFMLPYVLQANQRVREQREKLQALRQKISSGENAQLAEKAWLAAVFDEYGVKPGNFTELALRVDTVPPSLALAQSAVESGWGTSRFAREGNAPFGQWTTAAYRGMVPNKRDDGATYKIRSFDDLAASVDSYLRNLNTHRAYRAFRQERAVLRAQKVPVDSIVIAAALSSYSQEGDAYVALVRRVITENRLRSLDDARLSDSVVLPKPDA
jgi:Bax protein